MLKPGKCHTNNRQELKTTSRTANFRPIFLVSI